MLYVCPFVVGFDTHMYVKKMMHYRCVTSDNAERCVTRDIVGRHVTSVIVGRCVTSHDIVEKCVASVIVGRCVTSDYVSSTLVCHAQTCCPGRG